MLHDVSIKPVEAKGQAATSAQTDRAGRNACKPGIYWFWHHIPDSDEIGRQLCELKAAGYGTVFIQPRLAFPMADYLSPDYLKAYDQAMDQCVEQGLDAILYDEYNWISGHAGGRTVTAAPALREHQLFWSTEAAGKGRIELQVSGIRSLLADGLGAACGDWIYHGGAPVWEDWTLQSVLVYQPAQEPGQPTEQLRDLTNRGRIESATSEGCHISVSLPDGLAANTLITAFASARCRSSRLINYLHPEAGSAFIRAGYAPFAQSLTRHLGAPLKAVFFDQPYSGFYTWEQRTGNVLNSLMFHDSLCDEFQARCGMDISRAWLALVAPDAAETAKLRCDFFQVYGELARRNFFEPLRQWCQEHDLALSGHELLGCVGHWGHCGGLGGLDSRVNFGADHFALDSYKDVSAVDACNSQPQLSARLGSSLAKSHGRAGCLLEQYFAAPGDQNSAYGHWGLTLDELRGQSIRHLLQGASQVVFHGYCQTDGRSGDDTPLANPRHDFPPGINYEPWFAYHAESAREQEHLARFMAGAREYAPLAVLYPLRTYWHGGPDHIFNSESAWWHQWLSRSGYAFDLVDESQLLAGELEKYQALILPGVDILAGSESVSRLNRFVQGGGLLIASGPLPGQSQAKGVDRDLARQVRKLFGSAERAVHLPAVSKGADPASWAASLLERELALPVKFKVGSTAKGQLWTWVGEEDDAWRVALFNDSREARRVEVRLQQPGYLPQLSPDGGGPMRDWLWCQPSQDDCRTWLDMEPNRLICLRFRKAQETDAKSPRLIDVPVQAAVQPYPNDGPDGLGLRLGLDQAREGEILIRSESAPRLRTQGIGFGCASQGQGIWRVWYDTGAWTEVIRLDGEWCISRGSHSATHGIDPRRGWQEIWPDYSGVARYQTRFDLPDCGAGADWRLILPEVVCAVACYLNGELIAKRGWPPFHFDLPSAVLRGKGNLVQLDVANTAANRYCGGRSGEKRRVFKSGLLGVPRLQPLKYIEPIIGKPVLSV